MDQEARLCAPLRQRERKTLAEAVTAQFPVLTTSLLASLWDADKLASWKCGKRPAYGDGVPLLVAADHKAPLGAGLLIPTVMLLWRVPTDVRHLVCPTLHVPPPVSNAVLRGADVMLPGVYEPLPTFAEGQLVAVCVRGNPAPFAVGTAAVSSAAAVAGGMRGVGVRILHRYRDAVWASGGRIIPNPGFAGDGVEADDVEAGAAGGAGRDGTGAVAGTGDGAADVDEGGGGTGGDGVSPDDCLRSTFLQALKRHVKDTALPLLASNLAGVIMAACKKRGWELAVKRTRWRKFGAFLSAMAEEGLVTLSTAGGGTDDDGRASIVAVDRTHATYVAFRPWPVAEEAGWTGSEGKGGGEGGGEAEGVVHPLPPIVVPRVLSVPLPCLAPVIRAVIRAEAAAVTKQYDAWAMAHTQTNTPSTVAPPRHGSDGVEPTIAPAPATFPPCPLLSSAVAVADVKRGDDDHLRLLFGEGGAKQTTALWSTLPPPASVTPRAYASLVQSRASALLVEVHHYGWPPSVVTTFLSTYIALAALQSTAQRGRVRLDLPLADALTGMVSVDTRCDAAGGVGGAEGEGESVSREDAARAWGARWQRVHVLIRGERDAVTGDVCALSARVFRDAMPRVHIATKGLKGKKSMTFVLGLHLYAIPPAAFAKDISRRLAASASVVAPIDTGLSIPECVGDKGAWKGDATDCGAVQVQGGDVDAVVEALTLPIEDGGWGLPAAAVEIVGASGKGGSGKK